MVCALVKNDKILENLAKATYKELTDYNLHCHLKYTYKLFIVRSTQSIYWIKFG